MFLQNIRNLWRFFTILLPLLGFLKSSYKFFDGFFEIRYDLIWRIVVTMYYTIDNIFVFYKRYFNPEKQNWAFFWTFPFPDVFKRRICNLKFEGLVLETTAQWMGGSHFLENSKGPLHQGVLIKDNRRLFSMLTTPIWQPRARSCGIPSLHNTIPYMVTRLHPSPLWREFRRGIPHT